MPLPGGLVDALAAQQPNNPDIAKRLTSRRAGKYGNGVSSGDREGSGILEAEGGEAPRPILVPINATNAAATNNQTGIVEAIPEANDVEYLSPVKIGGQPVTLDFDTGSSDLWIFNSQLDPALTAGHGIYDPAKSKTFSMMAGSQFTIRYGDGSGAEGNVGTDIVDVGGAVAPAQAIEMATAVTQQFADDQANDGLMGLAFSSINAVKPQKQKTFFDNVMDSLQEPVFTADLRKGAPGAYEFGRVDESKFTGDMTWIPVNNSQGFWQFSSEKFAINGGQPQEGTKGAQAIADTGTTLILADSKMVDAYYAQVQGAQNNATVGGFTVPCSAQLPDLDMDIGGVYMAKVKGADINFAEVGGGSEYNFIPNLDCFGGLQATMPGGMGVYGDIMFKSQFVAFNGGNNTLGMAPHA
ncbi:hypothetical protein K4F52_004405 [Lecanicillium sp. MT-2017a]|nr:hypothetical protein K4F52_004405 [Lecanicillium sp. MT-2017a]